MRWGRGGGKTFDQWQNSLLTDVKSTVCGGGDLVVKKIQLCVIA